MLQFELQLFPQGLHIQSISKQIARVLSPHPQPQPVSTPPTPLLQGLQQHINSNSGRSELLLQFIYASDKKSLYITICGYISDCSSLVIIYYMLIDKCEV
ncbi:MAG: hypothetical protein WC292_02285 [Clostridia bacterium]